MALQVAELFKIPVNRVAVRVSGWNLTHESDGTINDYGIGSNGIMVLAVISRLWSKCKKCENMNDCAFLNKFEKWQHENWKDGNIVISTKAYLDVCSEYNLSQEVIDDIKDNNEMSFVRLGDAAHHAFHHKNKEFKMERITEIAQEN